MKNIIQLNITILKKIIIIINPLENIYSIKDSHLNNESIGRHVRHIIDFYLCFINGIEANHINYDLRDRNSKIETNNQYAIKNILLIIDLLNKSIKNTKIKIKINQTIDNEPYNSSIKRELMYIADHAIHHGHIIQLFIRNFHSSYYKKIEFYSPATLENNV